ncbi:hypothetical protein BpHYR1_047379 [Brachionus plicatilis]|uniref:Uncharacterized protein n=1 Tax=Brachionus plicatilis TaxID=10195 RepID=A0A3M7QTK7_BRAPC|nr:hypothetical protein BpHYR1_047379 [Brachionus plicatilis]
MSKRNINEIIIKAIHPLSSLKSNVSDNFIFYRRHVLSLFYNNLLEQNRKRFYDLEQHFDKFYCYDPCIDKKSYSRKSELGLDLRLSYTTSVKLDFCNQRALIEKHLKIFYQF